MIAEIGHYALVLALGLALIQSVVPIVGAQPSEFTPAIVGGIAGEVDTRFFPFIASPTVTANSLTASDSDFSNSVSK